MRQVIPNIYDTFTKEGRPGTVAAEVFEQFIIARCNQLCTVN